MFNQLRSFQPQTTVQQDLLRVFNIFVLVGGIGLSMLRYLRRNPPSYVIVVDVGDEIEKRRIDWSFLPHCRVLYLGDRETTGTLLAKHYPTNHRLNNSMGTTSACKGMGQKRGFGDIAAFDLVAAPQFHDICEEARSQALIQTAGAPSAIFVNMFSSSAGGVGSGATPIIGKALVRSLQEMAIPIEATFMTTESVTFAGLGPSVHTNAAAGLKELLEIVLNKNDDVAARVVWTLRLSALPPVRTDSDLRETYLSLEHQAWRSIEPQRYLQTVTPNWVHRTRYGNCHYVSTDFFNLIPEKTVAGTVASQYYASFKAAIESVQPARDLIEQLDPKRATLPMHRKDIDSIIDSVDQNSNDELIDATCRQGARDLFDFAAITTAGHEYSLNRVADYFVEVPDSLAEATSNLTLVTTFNSVIEQESAIVAEEIEEVQAPLSKEETKSRKSLDKLRNGGLMRTTKSRRAVATKRLQVLRSLSDELHSLRMLQHELFLLREKLTDEVTSQSERLLRVIKILDEHRHKGARTNAKALFGVRRVDGAFTELLYLPHLDNVRQRRSIAAQVTTVSVDGLAVIANSQGNNVEQIAERLTGPAPTPGAYVGGTRPAGGESLFVLPPLEPSLAASMIECINKRCPNSEVFVADSCSVGISVVRFLVNGPKSDAECLPGFYESELKKAKTAPFDDIYFIKRPPVAN